MSLAVLHTWYAIDHDEWFKTYHYGHHRNIDSVYTIYVKVRDSRPGFDKVKALVCNQ